MTGKRIQKPWVKVWIRMLHNREVMELPDSIRLRFHDCLLFAGEERNTAITKGIDQEDGYLPPVKDMAWVLHVTAQSLEDDMSRLALAGLVERKVHPPTGEERWYVSTFPKWQDTQEPNERQRQSREYRRERDLAQRPDSIVTDDVTTMSQNVTQSKSKSKSKNESKNEKQKQREIAHDVDVTKNGNIAATATATADFLFQESEKNQAQETVEHVLRAFGVAVNKTTEPLLDLDAGYVRDHLEAATMKDEKLGLAIRRMLDGDPAPKPVSIYKMVCASDWPPVAEPAPESVSYSIEPVSLSDDRLWRDALAELEMQMTRSTFSTWLAGTKAKRVDGGLVVEVRSEFAVDWLTNRLYDLVKRTVDSIAGDNLPVTFKVASFA